MTITSSTDPLFTMTNLHHQETNNMSQTQQPEENLSKELAPCPSPWPGMKADVFCSLAWMSSSNGLPAASYSPLEGQSSFADHEANGAFVSGPSMVMIVRYTKTPVGPYDEVVWIPGYFEVPQMARKQVRISRIYVSTVESVCNGRRNWNIPKQLAHFTFHPAENSQYPPYKQIDIAPHDNKNRPFISLNLNPITFLSRPILPISTSYVPMNMDIAMPPLPQSENWREDGRTGTSDGKWHVSRVSISGKVGLVKVNGKLGDGDWFPELKMDGCWFWVSDADMEFATVDDVYGMG